MPKIELPPCINRPKLSEVHGKVITVESSRCFYVADADCNNGACNNYEPEGGFDAVAAAIVREQVSLTLFLWYRSDGGVEYRVKLIRVPNADKIIEVIESGSTPTAALVAACLKYNEEVKRGN